MFAVVNNGNAYQSIDRGETWTTLGLSTAYFTDCECSSDGKYLVTCANSGRVRKGTFTYVSNSLAKFCLREYNDVNNTASGINYNGMYFNEDSDTAKKPIIKLYYYLDED